MYYYPPPKKFILVGKLESFYTRRELSVAFTFRTLRENFSKYPLTPKSLITLQKLLVLSIPHKNMKPFLRFMIKEEHAFIIYINSGSDFYSSSSIQESFRRSSVWLHSWRWQWKKKNLGLPFTLHLIRGFLYRNNFIRSN